MSTLSHERDLDTLFQLPLGEFTDARNALARAGGKHGAAIKALEKPSVPAWAVNQLYWRQPRAYDKLVRASDRVRAAHAHTLRGRKVDLHTLELQHTAAVKEAAEHVRAILARAGDPATAATMKAVLDTLQALPGGGQPGRLSKALAPIGFGAFDALMKGGVSSKALAEVVTFAPPKPKSDEVAAAAERADEAAAKRLRALDAQSKKLALALAAARAKCERATADVARLESESRALDRERKALQSRA